jgi:hypothetical protein
MKNLKIVLLSSVLAIGLGQAAHAVYTQDDLVTLKSLVEEGNTQGIMAFIQANPEIMDGSDPLAAALRDVVSSRDGFLGGVFGPRVPSLADVPDLPEGVTSTEVFETGSLSDFGS